MKNTKIPFLFFLVITLIACGKDTPATPDESQLNYPLSFNLSHFDNSGESKYYLAGDNDTYQEVIASDLYKTNFEDGVVELLDDYLEFFQLRKLALLNDTTVEVNYAEINPNTLEVEFDTTFAAVSVMDGEKISINIFSATQPTLFYFDEQKENLLYPAWIAQGHALSLSLDNLNKDFAAAADSTIAIFPAVDTFAVKFIDLVFEKE